MIVDTEDNVLKARTRLRQISDGFEYATEYNEATNKIERTGLNFVGSPKIDRLKEDLDEYEEVGRIIVYAGFQGSIDIIRQTCNELGWFVLQVDGRGRFLFKPDGTQVSDRETIQMALGEMDRSSDTHTIEKLLLLLLSPIAVELVLSCLLPLLLFIIVIATLAKDGCSQSVELIQTIWTNNVVLYN